MASYSYLQSDFLNATNVDISALQATIASTILSPAVSYINVTGTIGIAGTTYTIFFPSALSGPQQTTLLGIINAYTFTTIIEESTSNTSITTFYNKSLLTDSNFFIDPAVNSKRIGFSCSGNSSSATATLSTIATVNRTLTFPDITDTIVTLTATQTLTNKTASNLIINGTGSATASSSSFYSNPTSTAFTGSNNYFFNYFNTPPSSGSTTGSAYTVYINNAPANATTPFSLYVNSGKTYLGGVLQIPTGASNGYVLTSDANGNTSWESPSSISSFNDGTAALPGIFYAAEPGTGFYRAGAGQIGISLSGTSYVLFTTTNTTFTNRITVSATTNQFILGTTNTITLTAPAPAASRVYTIPDAGGAANFIMSTFGTAQTIAGGLTSSGLLTASNGFTLTTGALNLTSTSGAISLTGTTFITNTQIRVSATTNQFILGTTNTITLTAPAPAASRVYTIPDAGGAATFIMSTFGTAQTIAGGLTSSGLLTASNGFTLTTGALNLTSTSGAISLTGTTFTTNTQMTISATTNQFILGTTNTITLTAPAPAASRVYTIPDAGGAASFILSAGTQTLSGITTFSNTTTATSSTTGALIVTGGVGIGRNIWVGSAYTGTNTTPAGSIFNIPAFTYTTSTATPTNVNISSINQVTISNATAIANAASLYIANAPGITGGGSITNAYALQVAAGKVLIGDTLQIPTGAVNGYVLTSDAVGNATWAEVSTDIKYFSALVNGSTSTTSTTPILLPSMTLTPNVAGTYLVLFTTAVRCTSGSRISTFRMYKNGAQVTNLFVATRLATANFDISIHLEGIISFNGTTDNVGIYWQTDSGTIQCLNYRMLNATRLSA
jgi:hypothetical protein